MENVQPDLNKTLLKLRNFSFGYEVTGDTYILSDLSFTLHTNEVTLLMGASGSGKSSLALCLNGLYPEAVEGIAKGDIYFNNQNLKDFPKGELAQHIGVVFQDPESQFCMITVEDELAFTLENLKVPTREMPERILEVLRLVGMENHLTTNLHELSGGEKQKIALAAVLLLTPKFILLDEPTANLDPESSIEFISLIQRIQLERNLAILIIDHQADDWLPLIDRLLILGKDGRILIDGPPEKIFNEQDQLLRDIGIFLPKAIQDNQPFYKKGSLQETKTLLTIENLTFQRNQHRILHEINLKLYQGEFVSIVGRNGAGKSTLLQLMAGILSPNNGVITLLNKPLMKWKEKELRKEIGFVFQNPEHQFITDTVMDEITYGMKLTKYAEETVNNRAESLLTQFDLQKYRYSSPFSLSGGQKRRLSVATMLDEIPKLLLFDEPTFGQDAHTTHELIETIMNLKEKGTTIVIITHDMDLADLSDRLFVIGNQEIIFSGEPDCLWQQSEIIKKAKLRLPYHLQNEFRVGVPHDSVH